MNGASTKIPGTPGRGSAALVVIFCLLIAGCAGPAGLSFGQADTVPLFREKAMSVQDARAAIAPGRSTKAEILAALGKSTVIKFDSGYEVWVYRGNVPGSQPSEKTEFVILFGPDGMLKKSRVRAPQGQ